MFAPSLRRACQKQARWSALDFCAGWHHEGVTARASVPAQGQLLSIAQNQALFALLGTTFGGNGQTTFALPDLRGLAPVGLTYSICDLGVFPTRR